MAWIHSSWRRLEADEIPVPLCLRVDDSPFLLLSLENQAQFFLVLQHLGIWPVRLQRVLRGWCCLQSTEVVDQGLPADRALHTNFLFGG